ncbi:hypothetical protein SMALB_1842 [Streptomyces malaysiensis]|uniref:SDR family NAD(P)-dependent oxidoreductase n=2 Tax=Streptomyces malaysiensis TaxID=92644 RepID=A0A7X5WZJ4_STRMQ|nr:hypothetical protein [Streptomyces malaysiensis]
MAEWRRVFEVNLFGHIAVTQALLPALLRGKGRVINISSVGGKFAMATYGAYAGAKFALEAVSDSLRREVAPLGVQVVVVEPGGVRTEMATRGIATANHLAARMTPEQNERYGGLVQANNKLMASGTSSGLTADAAARVIAKAVTTRRPRTRYTAGRDAALIMRLGRMLSAGCCPTARSTASSPPTCAATTRREPWAEPDSTHGSAPCGAATGELSLRGLAPLGMSVPPSRPQRSRPQAPDGLLWPTRVRAGNGRRASPRGPAGPEPSAHRQP